MKRYGNMKATEFTKKQINVIYAKAKSQELKVEKWVISDFYNLADYYGYDDNMSVETAERDIKEIIETMFAGNLEKTQELINDYTERTWNLLSIKRQKKSDRSYLN